MTATPTATAPFMHRLLGTGMTLVAAVFIGMSAVGIGPLLEEAETPLIAYAMCGISAVLAIVALVVLKPRVPERAPGQSVEQFWSNTTIAGQIQLIWFLLETAAILAALAFLLAGGLIPVVTMGVAIVAFWIFGPNRFAKP